MNIKLSFSVEIDYDSRRYDKHIKKDEIDKLFLKEIKRDLLTLNQVIGKVKRVKFEDDWHNIVYSCKIVK
jgi:hypothetical protein